LTVDGRHDEVEPGGNPPPRAVPSVPHDVRNAAAPDRLAESADGPAQDIGDGHLGDTRRRGFHPDTHRTASGVGHDIEYARPRGASELRGRRHGAALDEPSALTNPNRLVDCEALYYVDLPPRPPDRDAVDGVRRAESNV
jgi:hypothetical protein